jgi:biopolymer transport protein ExbB
MITYLIKGGPVMIPIGLVSIAAGASVFIGWQRLREASKNAKQAILAIRQVTEKCDWPLALQILNQTPHPLLKSWQTGFHLLTEGKSDLRDIEEIVSLEGSKFVFELELPIKILGALSGTLTMLGFLGTIVGLIMSFQTWERLGAQVSISQLSGGIYQAMITTAAGLILAIPYHLIYHFFVAWAEKLTLESSKETTELFRKIKDALIHEAPVNVEADPALSLKS